MSEPRNAPALNVSQWFNTPAPIALADLRGRVVILHAFQLLCPGCVEYGLPQARRIARLFEREHVAVIGLHTVFEHHEAMTPVTLSAFIHEYRLDFPIGVDRPSAHGGIPQTMGAYEMQGTPTLSLIDRRGRLRKQRLGVEDDLRVGADIAKLLAEPS
jgi:peroxiredoxin